MSSESTDTLNSPQQTPPEPKDAGAPPTEPTLATDAVASAKKEAADNYDRYLRAVADLENFRRRTVREKEELRQFASSRVLEDILPVMDNLSLALGAAKKAEGDPKSIVGGVEMVLEQLKTALAGHGLKEINPLKQPFDANLHESIAAQPSGDVAEGNVTTVVRIGYSLNGRVLRPASVIVSSGAPKKEGKTS